MASACVPCKLLLGTARHKSPCRQLRAGMSARFGACAGLKVSVGEPYWNTPSRLGLLADVIHDVCLGRGTPASGRFKSQLAQFGGLAAGSARPDAAIDVSELEPAVQARFGDPEVPGDLPIGDSPLRATATASRRNSGGNAFGMMVIFPARNGSSQARSQPSWRQSRSRPRRRGCYRPGDPRRRRRTVAAALTPRSRDRQRGAGDPARPGGLPGWFIGDHAGLEVIHFPLALALMALAVWLPLRARQLTAARGRQHRGNTTRVMPG